MKLRTLPTKTNKITHLKTDPDFVCNMLSLIIAVLYYYKTEFKTQATITCSNG